MCVGVFVIHCSCTRRTLSYNTATCISRTRAIQIFPINWLCKTQRIYADQTLFRPMRTLVRKALRCLNITKRRSFKHWFSLECMLLVSNIPLEKGCYTPIWDSKIDMEWIYVLPVGWTWQEMYLWLLPNEIRHFLVGLSLQYQVQLLKSKPAA